MDGFSGKPLEPAHLFQEIARVLHLPVGSPVLQPVPPYAGPAIPSSTLEPIDWERGTRLWGRRALLRSAIARFVSEHASTAAALQDRVAQGRIEGVHALAHRLRGAAGNLALPCLQRQAQRMEDAALAQDAAALPALVADVFAALQAVAQALPSEITASVPVASAPQRILLSPERRMQAHAAAQTLEHALAGSELAQEPLDRLGQLLPATAPGPLLEAIDSFDFDQALVQLQQLRAHWSDLPTEDYA